MKIFALILLMFISVTAQSQKVLKNGCNSSIKYENINAFSDSISITVPGYKKVIDTTMRYKRAIAYHNADGEELQIWFDVRIEGADPDLKKPGEKVIRLSKVVGQYLTVQRIYTDYFGRVYDAEVVRKNKHDQWQTTCTGKPVTITFSPGEKTGYWEIVF